METQPDINKKDKKSPNHSQVVDDSDSDRPFTPTQKYHTVTAASVQVTEKSQDFLITYSDDSATPPCSPDFVYSKNPPSAADELQPPNEEKESSSNSSDICYLETQPDNLKKPSPTKYQKSPDLFESDSDEDPTPPCSPPAFDGYFQAPIKSGNDSTDSDRTEPSSPPYFYQETPEKKRKMGN